MEMVSRGHPLLKSKLAKRLTLYILGTLVGITLLISAFLLYQEYRQETGALRQALEQIEKVNLQSIEENLWVLDIDSLKIIIRGLLQKPDFIYFKLTDEQGKVLVEEGRLPRKSFIAKTLPLYHHNADGTRTLIGKFTMAATTEYIRKAVFKDAYFTLVPLAIAMLIAAILIIVLVWFLISRHLIKIQNYTQNIRLDRVQKPLVIDREENRWTRGDEFSTLVEAINKMYREIHGSYSHIKYQSLHDPLTGLANRRSLESMLSQRLADCRKSGQFAALLFVDLDMFKVLNDSLGHTIGDHILAELAKRLKHFKNTGSLVFRIGGDEFVILTEPLSSNREEARQRAQKLAQEVQRTIEENVVIGEREFKMTASIGIEIFRDEQEIATILKHADNAMYQAKAMGRSAIAFFHEQMQSDADKRLELEQLLRRAVQKNDFVIHYQPKFDREKKLRSAEALTRLQRADGTLILPGEFIPVAEETGMILEIDRQIVRKVFRFIARNRSRIEHSGIESIAINISPAQFMMSDFASFMIEEAERFGVDPGFIILEITEEAVVSNIEHTMKTMQRLKEHGFQLSIDDFGTGYSSLRYLMNFPLDELKIDKSFVDHIMENDRSIAVVRTIITMARNLRLNVVAEGVEKPKQFEVLFEYDCTLFQGYLFARPQREEEFLHILEYSSAPERTAKK